MEDAKKRSAPFLVLIVAAIALLSPCLYVASIGPVIRYLDKPALQPMWKVVYAPLEWAHRSTPLREPLEAYVAIWQDLMPGPWD